MSFRQYRATIDGVPMVSNEHGKFLPITPETGPANDQDGQNGNNTPHEATTDQGWEDA